MRKVVVGFDAGAESNDALALGHALAEAHGAELHVAIVLPRGHAPFAEAIAGGQLSEQLDQGLYEPATRQLSGTDFVRASSTVLAPGAPLPARSTNTRKSSKRT